MSIDVGRRRRLCPMKNCRNIPEEAEYCGNYCRKVDTTVSVTTTVFMYSKGRELGAIIGFIHAHSRRRKDEIRRNALKLAKALLGEFNQTTVSVVFPDETIVFENRQGWKPRQPPHSPTSSPPIP